MGRPDPDLSLMYRDYAARFATLSTFFGTLSTPEAVQPLLASLTGDDPRAFGRVIDGVDFPALGRCFWIREIVERVISTPRQITECSLRENLTREERLLYLVIAFRHRRENAVGLSMGTTLSAATGRPVIPPGPFLEELKANNLVNCDTRTISDTTFQPWLGVPERHCV